MSGASAIEWTDATWNPTRGCSRVSEGCRNCYAERLAIRQKAKGYKLLVKSTSAGPRWTGKIALVEKALAWPLSVRDPKRIFVNSMSDLFHENVPDQYIDGVFATMHVADQHTFQILTKRPERMRDYVAAAEDRVGRASERLANRLIGAEDGDVSNWRDAFWKWPLPNVHLGVSVEDEATAMRRIGYLVATSASVRWVSYEPALERVDFRPYMPNALWNDLPSWKQPELDWIVIGGESGPGARPFDVAWARQTITHCRTAGVPVFVKQMGRWILGDHTGFAVDHWLLNDGRGFVPPIIGPHAGKRPANAIGFSLYDRKGGDWSQWPEDLRAREFPKVSA